MKKQNVDIDVSDTTMVTTDLKLEEVYALAQKQNAALEFSSKNILFFSDVKKEMEEFEKSLPASFRIRMATLMANNAGSFAAAQQGAGAANELDIPHIPNNADIQVGDLLISSGLGQRFPPDYPVAEVITVERDPRQPFARIVARPTAHLEQAREVLLVWPQEQGVSVPAASSQPGQQPAVPASAAPAQPAVPAQAATPAAPARPAAPAAPAASAAPARATTPAAPVAPSRPAVPSQPATAPQPAANGVPR